MRLPIFSLIFSILLPATLIVPTDYPTIQAGFDAAADGDTILVLDGVYSGPGNIGLELNNDDRTLVLKSQNGPDNCIIDCQGQGRFIRILDTQITIDGFQIINGFANEGGAIIAGTGCNIFNCVFKDNQASGGGGAIFIINNYGEISHCIFQSNSASIGGAILTLMISTIISHCIFIDKGKVAL